MHSQSYGEAHAPELRVTQVVRGQLSFPVTLPFVITHAIPPCPVCRITKAAWKLQYRHANACLVINESS